jgi:hypothetical protein
LSIPLLLLTGCATSALWEEDRFVRFHEPAPAPDLRLFQAGGDVLVHYTETRDSDDKQRQRTYWLHENERRIDERRKPHFVPERAARGLDPIPVLSPSGIANVTNTCGPYALSSTNLDSFTLYAPDGRRLGDYRLPVYRDASGRVKQVLLTPVCFAADCTIVGGGIACIMLPGAWAGLSR